MKTSETEGVDTEGIFQWGKGSVDHTQLSPRRRASFVEPSRFVVPTLTN